MRRNIWVLALVLAACGGQAITSPTPTAETAQAVIEALTAADELEYLDFTLEVSGAMTQSISGTTRTIEADGQRMIGFAPADFAYQAIVVIDRDTPPGEHAANAQFVVGTETTYSLSGTLNLTSIEPFAGSFDFTGEAITAWGTFAEVPLTASLTVNGVSIPPVEVYYSTNLNNPTLTMIGEESAVTVLFNLPAEPNAGEYPVIAFLSGGTGVEAIVTADGVDLPQIEGTLMLTEAGERISGTFTLTASSGDGSQRVTVAGAFENVPYMG